MANGAVDVRLKDGQFDFSQGVDSGRVTTIASDLIPNGLKRSQVAWLSNMTCRGGSLTMRTGWKYLTTLSRTSALWQGGAMYYPPLDAHPYILYSIGGVLYRVRVDSDNSIDDLSTAPVLGNPATEPFFHFAQAEQFMVVQVGDLVTLPLFWDGTTLRRSNGITGNLTHPNINEIPAAGPMVYYMNRLWYANGNAYFAGDIVGNHVSGTAPYAFRDSVLSVTENPLATSGDGFAIPASDTSIRALNYAANLNASLGQGQLYVFSRNKVYGVTVPVSRADWILAGNAANLGVNPPTGMPQQTVAQDKYGCPGDRCVVPVNGDLYYQTLEPGIRSLALSIRYFNQWGNTPISRNINRVLQFNDRALVRYGSGINFDNRLWQTCLPFQTPVGVAHRQVAMLDFDLVSSFQDKLSDKNLPAWEATWSGLDVLQLFVGDFGGFERAFAVVVSRLDGSIELWELTTSDKFENTENRILGYVETPAFYFGKPFDTKMLDSMELWYDKVLGTVEFTVEWRVDSDPCWNLWHRWRECFQRDCRDDPNFPCEYAYPENTYCEGYNPSATLPRPKAGCASTRKMPTNIGKQFQLRITIKGWCRLRGFLLYALPFEKDPYGRDLVCSV